MKPIYVIGLLMMILTACESNYEYWDISKFNIDNNALEDNEKIKLLYTSRGPDNNLAMEYYIHLIAVSQKTGDTVNILTIADNGITMADEDKIFNFFNRDNIAYKAVQMDMESINEPRNVDDIDKMQIKEIEKVARDPKFDNVADNSHPTIIGIIGKTTNNE